MAELASKRMTIEEFLVWCDRQPGLERWELVDGEPRMMAPPRIRHQIISGNFWRHLTDCVETGPCLAVQEIGVPTGEGRYRIPDVTVDCGTPDLDGRVSERPTVVVEVLSPSTEDFDLVGKHEEYRSIDCIRHIVFVHAERPHVSIWTRGVDHWDVAVANDADDILTLDAIDCSIALVDLYRNTDLM